MNLHETINVREILKMIDRICNLSGKKLGKQHVIGNIYEEVI